MSFGVFIGKLLDTFCYTFHLGSNQKGIQSGKVQREYSYSELLNYVIFYNWSIQLDLNVGTL